MKPNEKWIDDWRIGMKPSTEGELAGDLLKFFTDFWDRQKLDEKSKTTRNRYAGSLHALGGHLVECSIFDDDVDKSLHDLLFECVGPDGGPLIFPDDESWQNEVDMVCRKIYKHMKKM
uniref:Uncharacterized protein n=1 Tax=Candidatus Kentrum sp. FW TaxID=2126338 RepID=A0A450S829_9GAMM|nr:MAG: hypothetical protein BECKFW1821A_GA0114235_101310 [Candidatus Kentron sp. FW]VFJ47981.1 MAG: hypothetical protein BECKFW1821B_GA0114236_100366 [Candidatus Kentron sp. FW]